MPEFVSSLVAERFAHALDVDDFRGAAGLLEEGCLYRLRGEEIRGRERVIWSFTRASEWAHSNLDQVTYEHSVDTHSELNATIRFIDVFEHSGEKIVHECLMHVELGPNGPIRKLTLEELPGERERVDAFLNNVGVQR